MSQAEASALVKIEDLSISFPKKRGRTVVVDRVSLDIGRDEILGLVGESGSGKTVTSMAIMGLTRSPGKIDAGRIWFGNDDLLQMKDEQLRHLRGRVLAMIFQNPRSALNPLTRVGDQLVRVLRLHAGLERKQAVQQAENMLKTVDVQDPGRIMRSYPHQLSGGMCQRLMIAMMIASEPKLLIADEPTTSLDVTIQAQIFELIKRLQSRTRMSVLLITHDLGVVAETCTRTAVMHAGHIVEMGDTRSVFQDGRHPYTKRLLGSVLRVDKITELPQSLRAIGEDILFSSFACRYANKCDIAEAICFQQRPPVVQVKSDHLAMCHKVSGDDAAADQG